MTTTRKKVQDLEEGDVLLLFGPDDLPAADRVCRVRVEVRVDMGDERGVVRQSAAFPYGVTVDVIESDSLGTTP